ncbi:MAG: asparagine synthase (glutamine-hydrolyzing), partial [Bacteroidota bacterium]
GIAGVVGLGSKPEAIRTVESMVAQMPHRGPDAQGVFAQSNVGLGHLRLSIIDLSDAAKQPMPDATGRYTMVYNGEVYNYQSIREELGPAYTFQSDSDTDVILASYHAWGPSCLEKLNGMFAFAIWDKVEEQLFVARDRLGIKPLYWYQAEEKLVFASEVRALLASGQVPRQIDRASLPEFLRYYSVNTPNTLIQGVKMLKAGHFGIWKDGVWEMERYWDPSQHEGPEDSDYPTVKDQVRSLLQDSVEKRMMSDVPFGAFLSGGIDSSAIVALMASVSNQPVHTFSVVFEEEEFDESPWSDLIAKKYRTVHHPIPLKPQDFLKELPAALAAMDHPSGDGLNSYVVSQATKKQGFTVALSGLGGDELFAG